MHACIRLSASVTQKEIGTILKKTSIDLLINTIHESWRRAGDINWYSAIQGNMEQTYRARRDCRLRDFEQIFPIR